MKSDNDLISASLERTTVENRIPKGEPLFNEVQGFFHVFLVYYMELSTFEGLNQVLYIFLLDTYIFALLEKGLSVSFSIEIVHIVV